MSDKIFFHVDINNIIDGNFQLDKSESHHFLKVLRKQISTEIWLTDGIGSVYKSIVEKMDNQLVSGKITKEIPNYGENNYTLNLGIGILKRDKMEYVIEKATECGVKKIYPIIMDRSIKRDVNVERLRKIAFTSVKQCGRSVIPKVLGPTKFKDYLEKMAGANLVFHESGDLIDKKIKSNIKNHEKLNLAIGPEGDFSENELKMLKDSGALFLNLGNRRLRSETAVVTALSQINLIFN
jgi:16S rRNA (uracil1498-N3)-methyltransferase